VRCTTAVTVASIAVVVNVPAIVSVCVSAPPPTALGVVANAPLRCTVRDFVMYALR
jgi:hypothetical protein